MNTWKGREAIELYRQAFHIIYPTVQRFPRWHGVMRDTILRKLSEFPGYLYAAAKTNQVSRVYEADGKLADIRFLIQTAKGEKIRALTEKQAEKIENHLHPVGARLREWQDAIRAAKKGAAR